MFLGSIPSADIICKGEWILEDEEEDYTVDIVLEESFREGQAVMWEDPNNQCKDRYSWEKGIVIGYKGRGAYKVAFGNKEKIVNRLA
jgi:hypothetical protein